MKKKIPVKVFLAACLWLSPVPLALGANPGDQDGSARGLLDKIKELEPAKLYTVVPVEEIMASARENREPGYLGIIQEAYGLRLGEFVGRLPVGERREDRIRHGINMICLMHAAWSTAWSAVIEPRWSVFKSAAKSAAWYEALYPTLYAASDAVWPAAKSSAWDTAWVAAVDGAQSAAWDSEKEVLAITKNLTDLERGRLSYRVSEVSTLLFYLRFALDEPHFEGIFSKAYKASDEVLKRDGFPKNRSIWDSQKAWEAFCTQHFGKLTADSLAFLTPFLDEIEKTRLSLNPEP
jgi:hypothetical protein